MATRKTALTTAKANKLPDITVLPEDMQLAAAEEAKALQDRLQHGSALPKINVTQAKEFVFKDNSADEEETMESFRAVVIGYRASNAFWDTVFQRGTNNPPVCAAVSSEVCGTCGTKFCHHHLVPFDKSPQKQAETCDECAMNEFGSDLNGGNGKACKNQRTLLVMSRGSHLNGAEPVMRLMTVSPTGIKAFDAYVEQLALESGIAFPFVAESEFYFSDKHDYPSVRVRRTEWLDQAEIKFYWEQSKKVQELLSRPPIQWEQEETAPAAPPPRRSTRKKATARR